MRETGTIKFFGQHGYGFILRDGNPAPALASAVPTRVPRALPRGLRRSIEGGRGHKKPKTLAEKSTEGFEAGAPATPSRRSGDSREIAAKLVGVSSYTVQRAVNVMPDLYFHISDTATNDASLLQPGVRVEFEVIQSRKGPRAVRVTLV